MGKPSFAPETVICQLAIMTQLRDFAGTTFVSVESYRRSGAAVFTPVWITVEGDKLYCWTLASSGKVKRIRDNPRVRLAKCSASGRIESEWMSAAGRILDTKAQVKQQARRMSAKYGMKFLLFRMIGFLRGSKAVAIEFGPSDPS